MRLWLGLLLVVSAQVHAGASDLGGPLTERLRAFADQGTFSGVVCVFDDTAEVAVTTVGLSDARRGAPLAPDSLFRIGSLSKTVTALALFRLAERGDIDLGASSAPVLSEVLGQAPPSTARLPSYEQLLHHTSGLRDPSPLWLPFLVGEDRRVSTARELLPFGLQAAQATPPGVRFRYANINYALLGETLRLHTGKPLDATLRALLTEPLGLRDLGVEPDDAQRARLSEGHFAVMGRLVTREAALGRAPDAYRDTAASGNLFASCGDFAALLRTAVWGPLFRKEETRRQWLAPAQANYAGGVVVDSESSQLRLRHAGAVAGYTSFFEVYPEARRGFVVLSNLDRSAVDETALARSLRALILEDTSLLAPSSQEGGGGYTGGGSRLLASLRLALHAALAPTVPGQTAQLLLILVITGGLLRKRARSRIDALAEVLGVVGGGLMLGALGESGLGLSLVLLAVLGCGVLTLLVRAARQPWLPPRLAQRGASALGLLLGATFLGVGACWSRPLPVLLACTLLLPGVVWLAVWDRRPQGGTEPDPVS